MMQSKDPFEVADEEHEESPPHTPVDHDEIETQIPARQLTVSSSGADTNNGNHSLNPGKATTTLASTSAADKSVKNKEDDDEEEEENMDVELGKLPSSSDPSKMAKMQSILSQFTEEQMSRYESFRRSGFQKSVMKRMIGSITGSNKISMPMTIVVSGIAKIFVGELVETAKVVMRERSETGPIRPCHIREAYRRLKLEGKIPKRSVQRLFRPVVVPIGFKKTSVFCILAEVSVIAYLQHNHNYKMQPPSYTSYDFSILCAEPRKHKDQSNLVECFRSSVCLIIGQNSAVLLIQLQSKLNQFGYGHFIVLPDIPSSDNPSVPSFCFRKSHGLLVRVSEKSEHERLIRENVKLFDSKEGESGCLDSVTVSYELVENVDRFIEVMDGVTNGGFLRGDESLVDWVELEWLKAKGYYSLEAFLVNRLEMALRVAWVKVNVGKKRGVKVKERGVVASGLAENVFWRKKGCVDWWTKMDEGMKRNVLRTVLGKAAKSLTRDILYVRSYGVENELQATSGREKQPSRYNHPSWHLETVDTLKVKDIESGPTLFISPPKKLSSVAHKFNSLLVVYEISTTLLAFEQGQFDDETLFFSSLGSVSTISDRLFRRLRGLLMVISLDFTKLELLEDLSSTSSVKKPKQKSVSNKKGKSRDVKKMIPAQISATINSTREEPAKGISQDEGDTLDNLKNDPKSDISSTAVEMEHGDRVVNGSTSKKSKRARKKHKKDGVINQAKSIVSQTASGKSGSSTISNGESTPNDQKQVKNIVSQTAPAKSYSSTISHGEFAPNDHKLLSNNPDTEIMPNGIIVHDKPVEAHTDFTDESNGHAITPILENGNGQNVDFIDREHVKELDTQSSVTGKEKNLSESKEQKPVIVHDVEAESFSRNPPYEWPNAAPQLSFVNSHLPATTDRLHLDVGHNWQNHFRPRRMPMSLDWPPMVHSINGLVPSLTCSYNTGYMSMRQPFKQNFGDFVDPSHITSSKEVVDDHNNSQYLDEDDLAVSGMDYSQYFGGGVMYWDSSDHPMASATFSRPPSLSSDDSSWAWREADMNQTVDDMVAFSSSYSTNGLTSPSATSFCSPFDPLGYVIPGEVTGKVLHSSSTMTDLSEEKVTGSLAAFPGDIEAKTGDIFPYPILRPIIIPNISRNRSREFKRNYEHKSPCVPPSKREEPLVKRPPSPVVLCVPRAPRPPPPSPVADSRKQRGFPTARSGSSSPRHWGVKGWFHDGTNFEEACVRVDGSEVVWPSWRKKSLSARQLTQNLSGALLQDRLVAISQLTRDQEHPDLAVPLQSRDLLDSSERTSSLPLMHGLLNDEIDSFCKQVAVVNMTRKPYINWAVKRVTRSLQVLWPRSRTNIFGSNATGLSLPTSDVDLVVSLPPVRNLEPIKEAGILEGRNGIKETCLQHAARYLANQEWVKNDSLKIVENTAIPIIRLVVEVPSDLIVPASSNLPLVRQPVDQEIFSQDDDTDVQSIQIDISFKAPSHTGLQTTELVKKLTEQFPAATPLALVLKQFLADRSLDQSYSGGLSSYCLILLITRFLQHEHHYGKPINQNFGALLMDFFYFFGNVFDPRHMRISVQGSGVYINRERGYSIDPIYIDDPLFPANNVGRNCFRIHQCIKAFADAYSTLEDQLAVLSDNCDSSNGSSSLKLLPLIIHSIAPAPDDHQHSSFLLQYHGPFTVPHASRSRRIGLLTILTLAIDSAASEILDVASCLLSRTGLDPYLDFLRPWLQTSFLVNVY
nr:nucleotidyltransferase family protein isoform 4 [Tanacetum cinerariifolium]